MNKDIVVPGLVGAFIGIVFTVFASPMWGGTMGYTNSMMGFGKSMRGSIDSHFIEQMIPHHEDAITMADLALEKAEHQEIVLLAQDIKRTQSNEIKKMQDWYKEWYGKEVSDTFLGTGHSMGSGMMHGGMMGDETDSRQLQYAAYFDKAFIEEMIPHHQMAVMMAEMLERTTNRAEMKQLAKDIIEAQTKEINSMRSWYKEWYR